MKIVINVSDEVIEKFCKDNDMIILDVENEINDYFKFFEDNKNFEEELVNKILNY